MDFSKNKIYTPLRSNRFTFDFGRDDLKGWRVDSATYEGGTLHVKVRESEQFYHPEYFQNNAFDKEVVYLKLLDENGYDIVKTTFYGVDFQGYKVEVDYKNESPLMTELYFTYEEVIHELACHNQQEEISTQG